MSIRIRVEDLPPKLAASEATDYQLRWQEGTRRRRCAFPEGELYLGRSSGCAVRVSAPGVRPRHLRLRRLADRVYVEPLPGAAALLNGKRLTSFSAWSPGDALAVGPVSFQLERISAEDRRPAIQIPTAMGSKASPDAGATDAPPGGMLGQSIRAIAQETSTYEDLLQALWHTATPVAATLLLGEGVNAAVLAEFASSQADIGRSEARRFEARHGEDVVILTVQFGDDEPEIERREICENFAWLALLRHRLETGPREPPSGSEKESARKDDIWADFAGARIRGHLAASTDMCRFCDTVLVLGETGTGKELAARALHRLWNRSGPSVAINCAAMPAELLDAELFGMEAGAATGVSARPGRIEQAEKGTLFLDEVTDLPLHLQTKLLRVLAERDYFRVGGHKLRHADVKIVAATNRPADSLTPGHLRPDLYFRLAQATLVLPPLRDRLADLPAICERLLTELESQFRKGVRGLGVSALDCLRAHSWPGNIRELQNVLRGLYAAAPGGGVIQALHLPEALRQRRGPNTPAGSLAAMVEDLERREIAGQLDRHKQVGAAARALGLSEGYLYRKMRSLKLSLPAKAGHL
jgi:DNA-binding NtrC family response regulator